MPLRALFSLQIMLVGHLLAVALVVACAQSKKIAGVGMYASLASARLFGLW